MEAKRDFRPWEELGQESERRFIRKYREMSKLAGEVKEIIDRILNQEIDKKEKKLKEITPSGSLFREQYIAMLNEEIENLYALRICLEREAILVEAELLLLNFLNKKAGETKKDLEEALREKDSSRAVTKNQELAELLRVRKELYIRVSGFSDVSSVEIEEKMIELGNAPEDAKGGIKAVYKRMKQDLEKNLGKREEDAKEE